MIIKRRTMMAKKEVVKEDSGRELLMALEILEKEKDISKETMFEAIEQSLLTACKQHFGKNDNMHVVIDRETGKFKVFAQKKVVMKPEDKVSEIAKEEASRRTFMWAISSMLRSRARTSDVSRLRMPRTLSFRRYVKRKDPSWSRHSRTRNAASLRVSYKDMSAGTYASIWAKPMHSFPNPSRSRVRHCA